MVLGQENLTGAAPQGGRVTYLRVSLEVILEKRLVEPRVRDWASGVASCDRLGEAGGPLYVAVRRSRSWSPWKVLRLAVPRGKRRRSGGVAPLLTLCVEAPAAVDL